ncbi:MAG: hypothetical protein V7K48_31820 [Nostoc sp.]|uniref:hypothetical protein n=1 Tax=Nostoc sp. TaxID=1180 RepID=UPI002FFBF706
MKQTLIRTREIFINSDRRINRFYLFPRVEVVVDNVSFTNYSTFDFILKTGFTSSLE